MSNIVRIEMGNPDGSIIVDHVDLDVLHTITPAQRTQLEVVIASYCRVNDITLNQLFAHAIQERSDQSAYERVCAARGLLPL